MSDSTGPVRRRRIAGESKPAAPVKKTTARKPATKKSSAKKSPAKKTPTVRTTPTAKRAPAPAEVAGPTSATPTKAPAKKTPDRTTPAAVAQPTAVSRETSAETPTTPGPSRRGSRWMVPAALLALVVLAAGVLLVVKGIDHVRGGEDAALTASQEQASSAASSAAETIFSFRYDQLDDHLKASKALMTPSFAKDFDKIAPALTELAPQRKIVVKAVTRNAGALACGDECSTDKAKILVFVDQARLVGDSKKPTVFANRISVSMVKKDSGWLVEDIRAL